MEMTIHSAKSRCDLSISASFRSFLGRIVAMMAMAMGTIIIAVAVLDIHIERNAVATINPKISMREFEPALLRIARAIRSCRPQRCMDIAMMNPPP